MHVSAECSARNIVGTQQAAEVAVTTVISGTSLHSSALLPTAPAWHPETGSQSRESVQRISAPEMPDSKGPPQPKLGHTRTLTAKGPPRGPWPGWCLSRISLHLAPKHQLQLLGIWRRDGIPPNRHLNQREPHAPDVRLH